MSRPRDSRGRFTGGGGGGGGGGGTVAGGVIGQVTLDTSQVDPAVAQLGAKLGQVEKSFKATAAAADHGGKGMASFGSRMLIASSFIDDMQYGLRAVVNQIPQAATAFGMSGGMAGAIAIFAVGINVAMNNWDKFIDAITTRGPETAAQEMERLGEKTGKTADEQARLNELKREEQQIEQQRTRRTGGEAARQTQVGGAVQETPYDVLFREVVEIMMRGTEKVIEAETQRRAKTQLGPDLGEWSPRRRAIRERAMVGIREEVEAELRNNIAGPKGLAEQLIRGAEFGRGRDLGRLNEMARQNPEMGGLQRFAAGVTKDLGMVGAEAYEQQAVEEEYWAAKGRGRDMEGAEAGDMAQQRQNEAAQQLADEEAQRRQEGLEFQRENERQRAEDMAAWRDRGFEVRKEEFDARDTFQERYAAIMARNARTGQTMGSDQYESSIKATTGESEETQQLKELVKLQKDIREWYRNFKPIGVFRRGGGGGR